MQADALLLGVDVFVALFLRQEVEILEEIMTQKLIAHHAVIDSIVTSDAEINTEVERNVSYFTQQLGTIEKVDS